MKPFAVPLSSLVKVFGYNWVLCIYLIGLISCFVSFVKCVGFYYRFLFFIYIKQAECVRYIVGFQCLFVIDNPIFIVIFYMLGFLWVVQFVWGTG